MIDVMVDLETMGTRPGCAVVSIGAIGFNPVTGVVNPKSEGFYTAINLKSCVTAGLKIDPDTLMWWLGQSDEARKALQGGLPLKDALDQFDTFWAKESGRYFWCHGATFDEPILRIAYLAAKRDNPWNYVNCQDTRTIFRPANVDNRTMGRAGTHHNALDDAITQANAVCEAYRKLGLTKAAPKPTQAPVAAKEEALF